MKAIALLSGGIDSPVAIHLVQKRVETEAIHFHQVPLTGDQEINKVKNLATKLGIRKTHIVPFANVFKALVDNCDHRYYYVLSKILMFQAAAKLGGELLVTGENLAQVSSQTLSNMRSITQNVPRTIIRPLLTFDKQEIVNLAKEIGTYEISKGPEICSLLGPKNPITKSTLQKVKQELEKIDSESLIKKALEKKEIFER